MKLSDLFDYYNRKRTITVLVCIVVVIVIIILSAILFNNNNSEEKPIVENTSSPYVDNFIPYENNESIDQSNIVSSSRAKIIDVKDLSTKFLINVQVGLGDYISETTIEADINTVFFDLDSKNIISPNNLKEGDDIILYSSGNTSLGSLKAHFVGVGEDTSYTYDVLKSVKGAKIEGYTCELENSIDILNISNNTSIINGYLSGSEIPSMSVVKKGSRLLYRYNPEFKITADGNIYDCIEVIVFEAG